jgi:hypothetical protein
MSITWFNTTAELLANGKDQQGLNITELYSGPFALVNDLLEADSVTAGPRKDIELAFAKIHKVTVGADDYVTTTLCRLDASGAPQWAIYCGDEQVGGKYRNDGKTLAAKLRADGKVSNSIANACEGSDWVGKVPNMTMCNFFRQMARSKRMCSHTQMALANIPGPDLEEMATQLTDWKSGAAVSATAVVGSLSPEETAFYDAAYVQHVLLAGERGAGKSYLARAAADKYDAIYLELQMHPSMEAWELFAHDRPYRGKTLTVMGKLAEAVYWVQKGKKVVLCMDEFFNMNPMYTTVINSPLSLTENDTYLINTGAIIGLDEDGNEADKTGKPAVRGIEETAEVPANMFWVVATSNIGARYGLDKMTPSVRARFQIILMNTNPDRTKSILEKTLSKYDLPLDLAEMFQKFMVGCNQLVHENKMDEEATTRLACNVVRACALKAKRDGKKYANLKAWLPRIKDQLKAEVAQVVNFELGPLDADQEPLFNSLVDTCFKVAK